MTITLSVVLAVVALLLWKRRKRSAAGGLDESSDALEAWLGDALERELADRVLEVRGASRDERRRLARSLRGDPDPEIVEKIEDLVRAVELEFTRYAHEDHVAVTARVRYDDGRVGAVTQRFSPADLPNGVRVELDATKAMHVFRAWTFPWARVRAL